MIGTVVMRTLSRVESLPFLTRNLSDEFSELDLKGYAEVQALARDAVREVAAEVQEGWSEKKAAATLEKAVRRRGVKGFFHYPFAWFSERTRFDGMKTWSDFLPTERLIKRGDVFILDVAPLYKGFVADIGYTSSLGDHPGLLAAKHFLTDIRSEIPSLFRTAKGAEVWRLVEERFIKAGYLPIHKKYPFQVLGHRLSKISREKPNVNVLGFSWQSAWSLMSRGLFGQLLGPQFQGKLQGLWAMEPHVGAKGFGAKFEEILVVTDQGAYWLSDSFI